MNCGIGNDKVQNILWGVENVPLPQSLEYVVISCGTNNLDTDDSEKIADGLFCIALALKKRVNHLKIVRKMEFYLVMSKVRRENRNYLQLTNCWKASVLITSIPIIII